jgi:hypothetical protein
MSASDITRGASGAPGNRSNPDFRRGQDIYRTGQAMKKMWAASAAPSTSFRPAAPQSQQPKVNSSAPEFSGRARNSTSRSRGRRSVGLFEKIFVMAMIGGTMIVLAIQWMSEHSH